LLVSSLPRVAAPPAQEMAPPKRKSVAPASAPSKKIKIDEWADVSKVLRTANLPEGVSDMLERIMPLTLGEFADHRHKFQEQMVLALEALLKEAEDSRSKIVTDLQSQLDDASSKKPQSEESKEEAFRRKDVKALEVREKKEALAATALAFRAARDEKSKTAEAKRADETEFLEAEKKKSELCSMVEDLAFLRDAAVDEPETVAKRASLVTMMRRCNFEDAMMVVLPAVFAKPPSARGEFDDIAVQGLDASLRKRLSQQEAIVVAGTPVQEKRATAVTAAEEALESAEVRQVEAAESYTAVHAEFKACEEEAASAQKAVRDTCARIKKLSSTLSTAEAELEIFRDGPLANFMTLKQRVAPVAEDEAQPAHTSQQTPAENCDKEAAPVAPGVEAVSVESVS